MKIEILITDNINEECNGMTAFQCQDWLLKQIHHCKPIQGIATIDGVVCKFSYSPYFNDGDIFCDDTKVRGMIKHIIPYYLYMHKEEYLKEYAQTTE